MQDYDDISNVMLAPMDGWKLSTPFFCFWKKPETTFMEIDKWSKKAVNHMNVKAPISSKVKASPFLVKLT